MISIYLQVKYCPFCSFWWSQTEKYSAYLEALKYTTWMCPFWFMIQWDKFWSKYNWFNFSLQRIWKVWSFFSTVIYVWNTSSKYLFGGCRSAFVTQTTYIIVPGGQNLSIAVPNRKPVYNAASTRKYFFIYTLNCGPFVRNWALG